MGFQYILRLLLDVEANMEPVTLSACWKVVTPSQVLRQAVCVETKILLSSHQWSQQARR